MLIIYMLVRNLFVCSHTCFFAGHILHRDLKLSNLLYTSKGQLKVAEQPNSTPHAAHSMIAVGRFWVGTQNGQRARAFNTNSRNVVVQSTRTTVAVGDVRKRREKKLCNSDRLLSYGFAVDIWAVGCIVGEVWIIVIIKKIILITVSNE